MPLAVVASSIIVDATRNEFIVRGQITASGSYPGLGNGDTLSFLGIDGLKTNSAPIACYITEQPPAGTAASGLVYNFAKGSTMANGKVEVLVSGISGAAQAQLGNVTYASVNAANIVFEATFQKFV